MFFNDLTTILSAPDAGSSGSLPPSPSSVDRSADFPGTATKFLVKVGDTAVDPNDGVVGWTISCHIRPTFIDAVADVRNAFSKGTFEVLGEGDAVFRLYASSVTDALTFEQSDGSNYATVSSANGSIVNNTWYFVLMTYTIATKVLTIAIDNAAPVTATNIEPMNILNADWAIGKDASTTTSTWKGQVSMIGIWTRVLTALEKTSVYNTGLGKTFTDLSAGEQVDCLVYYDLDEESDGSVSVTRASQGVESVVLTDPQKIPSSTQVPS